MPNYIEYYDNEGHYDVAYSGKPEGKKAITNTDEVNVALYATAQVEDEQLKAENIRKNRTILGIEGTFEGVSPSGTIDIDANGTYDVTDYASAVVDVPQPPAPSGKKLITTTEETDVASYATAQVTDENLLPENIVDGKTILGVEGTFAGIIPSGTKQITDTSLTDVASYASAQIVDANLLPENIAKGKTVLGIQGTHEGGITARVENEVLILSSGTVDNGVLIL